MIQSSELVEACSITPWHRNLGQSLGELYEIHLRTCKFSHIIQSPRASGSEPFIGNSALERLILLLK